MSQPMHVLIIDGATIFRQVFERMPVDERRERPEAVCHACVSSLARAVRDINPTHALVITEKRQQSWRHQIHPPYQATRKETPAQLIHASKFIRQKLDRAMLPVIYKDGIEARDLIASMSHTLSLRSVQTTILTTKAIYYQLVNPSTRIYHHFKREYRDEAWLMERYGCTANRFRDMLALSGYEADNIPGVRGVGYGIASKLLTEYGSLDAVFDNLDAIGGKRAEAIREQEGRIKMNQHLLTLRTEFSLGVKSSDICRAAA